MLTKVFWTIVALDAIAALALWKLFERGTHGYVVALYLAILVFILIPTCIFPLLRADAWRIAALIVLLLPSAPLLYFSIASAVNTVQEERQFNGSAYFQGPALALAQALISHDGVLVKQLIPAAGDLNQPHEGKISLWQYAVLQSDNTDESIAILKTLIAAGADPKRDTSSNTLETGIVKGPRLTRFLLEAGASPNVLDHEQRPVWWGTMEQGEDDAVTEPLRLMLDHGADLTLRGPDGRGPIAQAIARRYWYAACLIIEKGADWKQEKLPGGPVPQLLEWEIIRREEYPLPIPEKMRKVLAGMKGEPLVIPPAAPPRAESDINIPDLIRGTSFERLEQTRAAVSRLAQQRPDWVRRVVAFFEESDSIQTGHIALLLSLKPEALPEDVQERCWNALREQVAWYDHSVASVPNERKGWLLKEPAAMAMGLASIPGPARDRHRADFTGLRDRIEACRKANDAKDLADLNQAEWVH